MWNIIEENYGKEVSVHTNSGANINGILLKPEKPVSNQIAIKDYDHIFYLKVDSIESIGTKEMNGHAIYQVLCMSLFRESPDKLPIHLVNSLSKIIDELTKCGGYDPQLEICKVLFHKMKQVSDLLIFK